jgi:hypothetical protein
VASIRCLGPGCCWLSLHGLSSFCQTAQNALVEVEEFQGKTFLWKSRHQRTHIPFSLFPSPSLISGPRQLHGLGRVYRGTPGSWAMSAMAGTRQAPVIWSTWTRLLSILPPPSNFSCAMSCQAEFWRANKRHASSDPTSPGFKLAPEGRGYAPPELRCRGKT